MSPAVTTGGALRPECWPLPPPPSALGQPWTRAPGGGRDRGLRARRDVLSDTTLSSSHRRLREASAHRVAGMRGCVCRRGPEGGDGACPSCHLPQQVPGPPAPAPRPLAPGLLPGSRDGKHSLTGNFWEKCLGFAHVPAWVRARNPGRELCRAPHSPPATFPAATVPHHSGPRRVLVRFCFWSRLPLSC